MEKVDDYVLLCLNLNFLIFFYIDFGKHLYSSSSLSTPPPTSFLTDKSWFLSAFLAYKYNNIALCVEAFFLKLDFYNKIYLSFSIFYGKYPTPNFFFESTKLVVWFLLCKDELVLLFKSYSKALSVDVYTLGKTYLICGFCK